jgi:hypothetical protein
MVLITSGCSNDDSSDDSSNSFKTSITGYSQKGPFQVGTSVVLRELNEDFSQTGRSFSSEILTNEGDFEFVDIDLNSNYILLYADGFYFNEISGNQSTSKIELTAISDVTFSNDGSSSSNDSSRININILTHLEKNRVEYLLSQGSSFEEAKTQAINEIFSLFEMEAVVNQSSEDLELSSSAELLAISSILQGYRTEAEMMELVNRISLDLMNDGVLNDLRLGSSLINHAKYLKPDEIRTNLQNKYSEFGNEVVIPSPEGYIDNFIAETDFQFTSSLISYPEKNPALNRKNILHLNTNTYTTDDMAITADLRVQEGASLTIKIKKPDLSIFDFNPIIGSHMNWFIASGGGPTTYAAVYIAAENELNNIRIPLGIGDYIIEYYELGIVEPTIVKQISVVP